MKPLDKRHHCGVNPGRSNVSDLQTGKGLLRCVFYSLGSTHSSRTCQSNFPTTLHLHSMAPPMKTTDQRGKLSYTSRSKDLEDSRIISEKIKIGFPILPGPSRHEQSNMWWPKGMLKKVHANLSFAIISSNQRRLVPMWFRGFNRVPHWIDTLAPQQLYKPPGIA